MAILIVGGTGRVGREVAVALARRGADVVAMVRAGRRHPGSPALLDRGVRLVEGDLCVPWSLRDAVEGIDTVFCSATSMPRAANDGLRQVDHDGTLELIDAAEQGGVKRFIYVSYSGNMRLDSPLERAKRDCEDRLIRSGMEVWILRPSFFMEMWLSPALGFDPLNGSANIYGSGDEKVSYISSSNVADFAVVCTTAPGGEKTTILELGGPEALSQREAVRIFEQTLGIRVRINPVPLEALHAQHDSADPLQRTFGALMLSYAQGDAIASAAETAGRFRVRLRSVQEYASRLAVHKAVA